MVHDIWTITLYLNSKNVVKVYIPITPVIYQAQLQSVSYRQQVCKFLRFQVLRFHEGFQQQTTRFQAFLWAP